LREVGNVLNANIYGCVEITKDCYSASFYMHQDKLREKEFNDELEEIRTEINPPKQPKDMTKAECLEAFIVQSEASLRALQESAKLPEDRQSEKSIAIFMNGEAQDAEDVYFNFSGFEVVDMKYNFERHNIE